MHIVCSHMQKETRGKKGKKSPTYLDLEMMMRTQIVVDRQVIVMYVVRAMRVTLTWRC
jgi:hypothetical protein